ncbi:transcriptional regulator with XRE-family HTH domain [Actinoplanes octamycinicus]|uniref:Transcriptional regulator with XRE-family HTH domain n=2 Tax=Actinoplanes octamycinicus TaxID=135948 RepID=A0A7W7H6W0_9ACTN|nr:transcriptional regulator with XRE-family HTH domain [Actinoplanes octamycinicus]
MRRARRLSGAELAVRVGMSQPKISRIERGRGVADPKDVVTIARALGADDAVASDLQRRAEGAQDRMTDWRPSNADLANRQNGVAEWEASATEIRDFQPAVLPGLLQTGSYIRAALLSFQRLVQPDADETAMARAVTARTARQEVLADPDTTFHFVVTEAVLRNRLCPPEAMLEQLTNLRLLARRPNVILALVPEGVPTPLPPLHGFTVYDEDMVVIDAFNTGLLSRGGGVVRQYRHVFDLFRQVATTDIEPILDRYRTWYLAQLTDDGGGQSSDVPGR